MFKEFLAALGPQLEAISGGTKPNGYGVRIEVGHQFKCAGKMGPNPDLDIDPTVEPEILIQHVIGTVVSPADEGATCIAVGNDNNVDACFELDPAQKGIDVSNPVCRVCGMPATV